MKRGLKTAVTVIATAALLAGAALALASVRAAGRPRPVVVGPLAGVLMVSGRGSDLVVADVGAMRVVRTIRLRSLATDVAFDASSGLIVTAQAGGVGDGADDVIGEADARTGDVRYVRLACPNPGNVACVAGRAYVLHGMVDPKGMVVTRVDVARARVDGTSHVPEGPGIWSAGTGAVWTAGRSSAAPEMVLRMSASDLSTSALCPADGLNGIVPELGDSLLLLRGGGLLGIARGDRARVGVRIGDQRSGSQGACGMGRRAQRASAASSRSGTGAAHRRSRGCWPSWTPARSRPREPSPSTAPRARWRRAGTPCSWSTGREVGCS